MKGDEELWSRYFAAAFAGRQGSLEQVGGYIADYVAWADKALAEHRKRWPVPEATECMTGSMPCECPEPLEDVLMKHDQTFGKGLEP